MNLSTMVNNHAQRVPNWDAVVSENQILSWKEFNDSINKLGNALRRLGIKKGDRVAIYLPNSPEYIVSYFAVVRIGAIVVPLNLMYRSSELNYIINNSGASLLIGMAKEVQENITGIREQLSSLKHLVVYGEEAVEDSLGLYQVMDEEDSVLEVVDCAPDDLVAIIYTAGTTGVPKGAMLTHSNFWEQAYLMGNYCLHTNDQDRVLLGTPYSHIFFVFGVLGAIYKGAAVVTMPRFYPDKTLELISKLKITHMCGVPTMYIHMLPIYKKNMDKYDLSSWRVAQSAGAAIPGEIIPQIENIFKVDYFECYGSTESSTTVTYERVGHVKAGSVGLLAHNWQMKIVDENNQEVDRGVVGEMVIKGSGLFKGYWQMPEETAAAFTDGWFHTGDLGYEDTDGYFYIVDRKKDMIICAGYNIYPREVEELLYTHPAVLEAAVVGIPDEVRGEVPKAFIALKSEMSAEEDEIIAFCKARVAAYKVPRAVEFLEELPKSPTGKILKREIKL